MELSREAQRKQKRKEFNTKYGETIRNEKDTYIFTHAGLNCLVLRNRGHLNGYVNIPADHLLYKQGYGDWIDEDDTQKYSAEYLKVQKALSSIKVHGGLTFADHQTRVDIEGKEYGYLLGFDTAHCDDAYVDPYSEYVSYYEGNEYRDAQYVIAETKKLAEQIAEIKGTFYILLPPHENHNKTLKHTSG